MRPWLADGHPYALDDSRRRRHLDENSTAVPGSVHGQLDFITTPVAGNDGSAVVVAKYDATPGMDGAPGQRVFYRTTDRGAHWTASSVIEDPGRPRSRWSIPRPGSCSIRRSRHRCRPRPTPGQPGKRSPSGNSGRTTLARSTSPIRSMVGWWSASRSRRARSPHRDLRLRFRAAQHLVATDDGGATWVEVKP